MFVSRRDYKFYIFEPHDTMVGDFETARKVYESICETVKTLGVKKIKAIDSTSGTRMQ